MLSDKQNTSLYVHANATDTGFPEKQTIDQGTINLTKPTKATDSSNNKDL